MENIQMDSIQLFDFTQRKNNDHNIGRSFYFANEPASHRYNAYFSDEIAGEAEKAGMTSFSLASNTLTGEWYVVFTKRQGLKFSISGKQKKRLIVYCKEMADFMLSTLLLDPGRDYELSENLCRDGSQLTYRILL